MQSNSLFRDPLLPVTRILYLTPGHTIDPPSARLLEIHRAIGRILNLSGAGDSIDRILRDMDEVGIKENGSTELGQYISLKFRRLVGRGPSLLITLKWLQRQV